MTKTTALAIALIAFNFGSQPVNAQALSSVEAPAEFPPASFKGRQYVDSNGCVFVRAGIDGNVTWVPRVSRNRKVICGFQPSLAGAAMAEASAQPQPAEEVVQIIVDQPAAKPEPQPKAKPAAVPSKPKSAPVQQTAKVQPKPVKNTMAVQPEPKPKPNLVMVPKAVPNDMQPTIIKVPAAKQPVIRKVPKTVTIASTTATPQPVEMAPRQSACRGASAISSQYLVSTRGLEVRCGPQAEFNVRVINGGNARENTAGVSKSTKQVPYVYVQPTPLKRSGAAVQASGQTRIVPKSVYESQIASTQGVYIPKGYKPAWEDDRLNPKRAHQTFEGQQMMALRWTNTVPRRLVEAESGRDVAYLYPGLMYPNTTYEQQMIAGVTVATRAPATKFKVKRANKTRASMETAIATPVQTVASARVSKPTVSVQPKPVMSAGYRYVQAGTFADMANAQNAAQRIANSGLPAKLGKRSRGGKTYGVVVAGPFQSQTQLSSALQRVRSLGFGDAFLRK